MPIERIVIAGGGVAGWLAASMLARRLDPGLTAIHLVEQGGVDDSLGIPQAAEILLPATVERSALAGYDEDTLIRAARGSFALGTALTGWGQSATPAFLPFGEIGAAMGPVAFHQLAARLRAQGTPVNLANYTLAALCAQAGRFSRPQPDDRGVLSTLSHGIHVETSAFAAAMKGHAVARGVAVTMGRIADVVRDATGLISDLVTEDGARIPGDLFIDAAGPSTIIGGASEDWSRWLPCNRAATALHLENAAPLPFAQVEAHGVGWQSFVPLRGATGETFVFHDTALPDGPGASQFTSGRRAEPWQGNCLAIGGAAAVIDPVAGTQLHLAQSAIARLLTLLPNDRTARAESAEHNRQTIEELERARDYAILFYKANGRTGEAFWDDVRAMPIPDGLAHKIALYESCGRVALHDGETFEDAGWISLFEAFGIRPRRHDALANGIGMDAIAAHFARVRDVMLKAVATMPPHADYLRSLTR